MAVNPLLEGRPAPLTRSALTINVVSLGLLSFGVVSGTRFSTSGSGLAAAVLTVVAGAAWVAWSWTRYREPAPAAMWVALAGMAVAGGALAAFAPLALTYVAVASFAAAMRCAVSRFWPAAAAGPLATLVAVAVHGHQVGPVISAVAASLAGAVIGMSRRDAQLRTAQAASVEVARAQAEVLAARNHLARELHDVLAHTLSALAVQLQALDALVMRTGRPLEPEVVDQLEHVKRLVREGLDEARGAVQALREDVPPLEDRLARLAADRGADVGIEGPARPLPPEVALALYRAAQEALTNATKHAPGSRARVRLEFGSGEVTLVVSNPSSVVAPAGPGGGSGGPLEADRSLASSGGGYGIQGIKERMLLLGGRVEAGPHHGEWVVSVRVPA